MASAGRIGCLIALFVLAACRSAPPPAQEAGSAPPPVAVGPTVTVQEGDTVYEIAQRYNVPLRDLIEANNLGPPFDVRTGAVLRLPATREHIVQSDETLSQIAERHAIATAELAELNGIDPPYTIYVGQALRLPGPPPSDGRAVAVAQPSAPPTASPSAPGSSPFGNAPAVGEPVSLAPNPGPVERQELAPPGRPSAAASIFAGRAAGPASAEPPDGNPALEDAAAPATAPGTERQSQAAALAPAAPDLSAETAPARAGLPQGVAPPARSGALFQWPVRGQLIAGFGETIESGRNEGINIAAPRGTPILAAENGVVAYAGNELRGYGNLLLIRHADGWVTAYAHTDEILVARGEQVTAGQQVATVGDTGAVSSPQLHFEVRQGSDSVDPLGYLP